MSLINEAFKELKGIDLDEELFSFDEKGARDLSYFLDDTSDPVLDVVDPLATDEEELQPNYEGNVICQCCVCKQLIYKKPEDIVIDEETQNANVGEECPHCYNTRGFKVIGQVEPYFDKDEVKVTVDDDEVAVEDNETEEVTESLNEAWEDGSEVEEFIGLRGTFRGLYPGDLKKMYSSWDRRLGRPTDPEEKEDYDELRSHYGETVEIIDVNQFNGSNNPAESLNNSYWEIEFEDGTSIAGIAGDCIDFHNMPSSNASISESWEDAYEQFTDIIDHSMGDPDQIEKQVNALYAKHKGEKDWDFAYRRWMEGSESPDEDLDESASDEKEWGVWKDGGSIGEPKGLIERGLTKEEAQQLVYKAVKVSPWMLKDKDKSLNESRTDKEIIDDYIGRRGKFRGYITAEVKPLYDTWDDKLKRPTAPEEIEDYEKLRDTYGKTVEITDCSIFIKGNSRIDTFDTSYWDIKFNDGTSLSSVSGSDIDLYEDPVKTKKGRVNKGKAGIHETFKTKKAADAQRKAMYASGYKGESLKEDLDPALVAKMDKESFVNYVTVRKGWTTEEAEDYLKTYFDEALDEKLTIEVTEEDINHFDEDTGDVIVDKAKFVGKDVQKGDYVTLKFTDENEDADTQDYKFVEETEDGFKLEWIGTKELHEDFQKATVETGSSILSMESDDSGKVTVTSEPRKAEEGGDETIAPVSDEVMAEIEDNNSEETEEETTEEETTEEETTEEDTSEGEGEEEASEEEEEVSVDEFEESYFNDLGKKYLQEVYNNVTSYETTKGSIDGKKIKLEGVISFKSGKRAKTEFFFEGYSVTKAGKVKFLGENAQITGKKNAFTLTGSVNKGKLFAESLTYNYRAKDAVTGKTVREYGTVKR